MIISILAQRGIHPQPLRTLPRFSAAGIEILYGVEVPTDQVNAATVLLERYGYRRNAT